MTATADAEDVPRLSVKPLWSPSMWVIDTKGRPAYEALCAEAGLDPRVLLNSSQWVDLERAVDFLARVRQLTPDEAAFRAVCIHRMKEAYGPLLLVLPVATPRLLFRGLARTVPLFSSVSRCTVVSDSRTHSVCRYETDARHLETRELCLSRAAAVAAIPEMFGLPPAILEERSCIARGDAYCEFECRFYTRYRWMPIAGAALLGGATAYGLGLAGVDPSLGWSSLPIVFGLLGAIWELRKTSSANVQHGLAIQGALEELALHESEARREIVAFHQRQKEWGKLMEEQVSERTAQLEMLMERLRTLGEDRVTTVRGVSHDLRNPMQVLRANQALMRRAVARGEVNVADGLLDDNEEVIDQMETLLRELSLSARSDRGLVPVNPAPMLTNTCYSFVDASNVVHVASVHAYDGAERTYKTVPGSGGLSPEANEKEGLYAWNWARTIWADSLT